MDKLMGTLKSDNDPNDWIFERLVHGSKGKYYDIIPESYSLEEFDSPGRHQGKRSTCAPFAGVKISEINTSRKAKRKSWIYLSPEFIYYHRTNKPAQGMFGRDVFRILRHYGTVPEDKYPYMDEDDVVNEPNSELYKIAMEHRIKNYARVNTIEGLKRALIELGPCYIGLPMFNLTERFWDREYGTEYDIGHAVTAIGYTDKGFIIKNSWGSDWGDDGKAIFPFEDFAIAWEIWVPISA
jgi:C1A family cysteine protease